MEAPKFENQEHLRQEESQSEPTEKSFIRSIEDVSDAILDGLDMATLGVSGRFIKNTPYEEFESKKKSLDEKYDDLEILSDATGAVFEELIPEGLNKPEVTGYGRGNMRSQEVVRIARNKEETEKILPINLRKPARSALRTLKTKGLFSERFKPFNSGITERERATTTTKEFTRSMLRDDMKTAVYEHIETEHPFVENETDTDGAFQENESIKNTELLLRNLDSGRALDLRALLPQGFEFKPGVAHFTIEEYATHERIFGKFVCSSRTTRYYRNEEEIEKGTPIGARVQDKYVQYGDLLKSGGMISLFHEIAHAWQTNYSREGNLSVRQELERTVKETAQVLIETSNLQESVEMEQDEGIAKTKLETAENHINTLVAKGIYPVTDSEGNIFYRFSPIITEDVFNIKVDLTFQGGEVVTVYYPVHSDSLTYLMNLYIAEERDAWAHALKMMRFLRTQGFDIEPGFESSKEITDYIAHCLDTYQQSLNQLLVNAPKSYNFSRRSAE